MVSKKKIQTRQYLFLPRRKVPITGEELDFLYDAAVEHKQEATPSRSNHLLKVRTIRDKGKVSWGCKADFNEISTLLLTDELRDLYLELTDHLNVIQFNYMTINNFIRPHTDRSRDSPLGCVLGLTDNYRGGQLHFTNGPMLRVGRGDLLMIRPPREHKVYEVTSGEKITIAYWIA